MSRERPLDLRRRHQATEAQRLVDAGVCGRGDVGATELAHFAERVEDATRADVVRALHRVWGSTLDAPYIDPSRTLAAAARAATELAQVATAHASIVFATASPASLLPLHQRMARLARAAGATVVSADDSPPTRVDGRIPRRVRAFDAVAAVTDGASIFATADVNAARHWAASIGRPALAVVDGPFALAALERRLPTLAFVDLRDLAVGVAGAVAVPLHLGRPPDAYGAIGDVIEAKFAAAVPAAVSRITKAPSSIES